MELQVDRIIKVFEVRSVKRNLPACAYIKNLLNLKVAITKGLRPNIRYKWKSRCFLRKIIKRSSIATRIYNNLLTSIDVSVEDSPIRKNSTLMFATANVSASSYTYISYICHLCLNKLSIYFLPLYANSTFEQGASISCITFKYTLTSKCTLHYCNFHPWINLRTFTLYIALYTVCLHGYTCVLSSQEW